MRVALIVVGAIPLCACSILDTNVQRGYAENAGWRTSAAFTTADVRIITQRTHPALLNPVVCTEPSPDVASAISSAAAATASGGNGAANGSLGVSGSSAEALAELAGRSTALLGLRDSLFRTCEAYANGAIGQDAYALVLSRYTQLMTTLFLAQDITGAAGAEGKAAAVSAALQAAGSPQASGSKDPTTTTTTTTDKGSAPISKSGKTNSSASAISDDRPKLIRASMRWTEEAEPRHRLLLASNGADPVDKPVDKPEKKAAGSTPPATDKSKDDSSASKDTPQSASAAGVSTAAALALTRMNEDYLDQDVLGVFLVACINESDPTRYNPTGLINGWLEPICKQMATMDAIVGTNALIHTEQRTPVNPEVAAVQLTAKSDTTPGKTGTALKVVDPIIAAVQFALRQQTCEGCKAVVIDGVEGEETNTAVRAFQKTRGLAMNGKPKDPDTLRALGLPTTDPQPPRR